MPKYIIEQLSVFRNVYIVEADNQEEAVKISEHADDNWQEWLGCMKIDINEYTDERVSFFKNKQYFWDGVTYKDKDGYIAYHHPSGEDVERKEIMIK